MIDVYEESSLTPIKVAKMSGYLDWASEPSIFKHYPNFLYRYKYAENELLRVVELCRIITSERLIGDKPYYQLNAPSAGNLHPVELYVQIRGVKGIISGIYHVDAGASEIVLIREVESEGLEAYVGLENQLTGMIFVVSIVPFRAEWKYAQRAIRYCYLDVGHQVGAISASLQLHQQKMTIVSDFDKKSLNEFMGFKGEEFVAAVISSGILREKKSQKFKQNLMHVMPSDYSELDEDLAHSIAKNELLKSDVQSLKSSLRVESILQRRSSRFFDSAGLLQKEFEHYMHLVNNCYPLKCYNIVLNSKYEKAGVYSEGKLLFAGEFTETMVSLLVDQSFIKNADVITVVTSNYFSANKLIQAGAFVHTLYLEAQSQQFGLSGIGAFYDKKLQSFLEMQDYILYVCVAGAEKK